MDCWYKITKFLYRAIAMNTIWLDYIRLLNVVNLLIISGIIIGIANNKIIIYNIFVRISPFLIVIRFVRLVRNIIKIVFHCLIYRLIKILFPRIQIIRILLYKIILCYWTGCTIILLYLIDFIQFNQVYYRANNFIPIMQNYKQIKILKF